MKDTFYMLQCEKYNISGQKNQRLNYAIQY